MRFDVSDLARVAGFIARRCLRSNAVSIERKYLSRRLALRQDLKAFILGSNTELPRYQENEWPFLFLYANLYNEFQLMLMKQEATTQETATALLRVAAYLGRPQNFIPVADARAEMRRTLDLAAKGSVVLTTHGEPAAAVVSFAALVDMRHAVLHLLVDEMGASFERSQERAGSQKRNVSTPSEEELEALVGEAVRNARKRNGKSSRKIPRN